MRDRWDGGYKHRQKDGQILYILEKKVGGKKFHISTRCHSEAAAYEHYKRFQADPWKYAQEMEQGRDPGAVLLDDDLVAQYRRWMLSRPSPATLKHANEMTHRLGEWALALEEKDLRRLTLPELKTALEKDGMRTNRQHRIIAIKAFFTWLREERNLVPRRDDPTLDLKVPQAVPEKHKRRKAVPVENVRAALRHLAPAYRDCLLLMAHTGWHVTELARFAREPDSRIAPGQGDVLGVLQVLHKSGATTRTPVKDARAFAAAQRIRARGEVPRRLNKALGRACKAAKVPAFGYGVLRHSVATWAIEAGTPAEVVADFLGHRDKRTTLKFYADVGVPTLPVRLPKI